MGEGGFEILIVEDSATQRVHLEDSLTGNGFVVRAAEDGERALAMLEGWRPGLVIADVLMPGIDGYELCRRIKRTWPGLPVLLLTTLREPQDILRGLECGADNYLSKPYTVETLLDRIGYLRVNHELRCAAGEGAPVELAFAGKRHALSSDHLQTIDYLLSTYEESLARNRELREVNKELRRLRDELEKRNRALALLNEQKNELLGMVAHDLRNPLGVISGYSVFLSRALETPDTGERAGAVQIIDRIKKTASFMLGLVGDLVDMSALESGKLTLRAESVNVREFLDENVALNETLARPRGVVIARAYDGVSGSFVVDRGKIDQVLNHLIGTAVKYSGSETTVTVGATSTPQHVLIEIRDQGPGIPREEIGRLFTPFATTSVRAPRGEKSTGLGLAIVHKIVEGHRGRIWVESNVGEGSRFFVQLPRRG